MLKTFPILSVFALIVLLSTSTSARPQLRRQVLEKSVENREQDKDDLEDGADKDDLKGSASYGYGYYGYPIGGLYGGGLYGGGGFPYSYSLHSGYYGGYYPYYGGFGSHGHFF